MTIAFISHPDCLQYQLGSAHPESPGRLRAIDDQLLATGLELALRHHKAPPATREQLARAHDAAYVERIFQAGTVAGPEWVAPDTTVTPQILEAALHAAGAAIFAVDLVMREQGGIAFCSVRPPGHHAGRAFAMGLCLFNNVAVGAAHALHEHGLERVAIVDFDAHRGNGTEDIAQGEPRLLLCSTFQERLFPYSEPDAGASHAGIVNVALQAGATGAEFRASIERHWLPRLDAFEPQLLLVSAGFDGHAEDDMSDLLLHESDFAWVTREIKRVADRHAAGRIVSVLEGGYALGALGRSVAAHLDALLG